MTYLGCLVYPRVAIIFQNRNLPSVRLLVSPISCPLPNRCQYLGPSAFQLTHLFILLITLFLTWTALTILLVRTAYSLCTNTTTIESWEIDRHATLLRRARYLGGYLDGPDGQPVPITKQEFPYDIGVRQNLTQGMGTANPLLWFWPFSKSPSVQSALEYEVNGFEDPERTWPPPDPDRMPRAPRPWMSEPAFVHEDDGVEAFRRRQEQDLKRWDRSADGLQRRKPFVERLEAQVREQRDDDDDDDSDSEREEAGESLGAVNTRGEESWKNSEGESLADFGLDEDAEFYDEDIPLSLLMRRKQLQKKN